MMRMLSSLASPPPGYVRNDKISNKKPVTSFTLKDLNEGHIYYVDHGVDTEENLGLR